MVEWILEPLKYDYFIRGLLNGIIAASACGILSSFIIFRGMAFIGDAVAHSILPGVVVSYIFGANLLIGALVAAILSVLGIGFISKNTGLKEDTAIGVIFTGAFALGILLISKIKSFKDLSHILFGNIFGISDFTFVLSLVISFIVFITIFLIYKELLVTSFDTTHATAIGLSPLFVNYILLILVALTTVIITKTVGVVLVLGLLVTPAAISTLLFKSLKKIILFSCIISIISVVIGFYLSYHLDYSTGPGIVIILTIIFLATFVISKIKLIITKNKQQSRF
jgi:ABC-type Mn2+/Zn2+ transport system permease subunit